MKNLLLIGSAAWIGYMLYTRYKTNKDIQSLKQSLASLQADLTRAKMNNYIIPPDVKMPEIFPASMDQAYNTSRNATVSPAPYNVSPAL